MGYPGRFPPYGLGLLYKEAGNMDFFKDLGYFYTLPSSLRGYVGYPAVDMI